MIGQLRTLEQEGFVYDRYGIGYYLRKYHRAEHRIGPVPGSISPGGPGSRAQCVLRDAWYKNPFRTLSLEQIGELHARIVDARMEDAWRVYYEARMKQQPTADFDNGIRERIRRQVWEELLSQSEDDLRSTLVLHQLLRQAEREEEAQHAP